MKKLLALVLALVMTLGLATVGSNAALSDLKDADKITEDRTEAFAVLNAIKIFEGDDNGNLNPGDQLTRAQAAKIIATLNLGKTQAESLPSSGNKFTDVAATNWASGYVNYCEDYGIIAGRGDGTFDPQGDLTVAAFAKMLLVSLGYDATAEKFVNNVDWQIPVMKLANQVNLFEGFENLPVASDKVTRSDAAQMVFNTLKTPEVTYGNYGYIGQYNNPIPSNAAQGTAIYKTTAARDTQTISTATINDGSARGTYMVEFAEEHFPKLTRNSHDIDIWGRPSTTWTLDRAKIGSYENFDKRVDVQTKSVTGAAVYKTLGGATLLSQYANDQTVVDPSFRIFVDGHELNASEKKADLDLYETLKGQIVGNKTSTLSITGAGAQFELFLDDDSYIDYGVNYTIARKPVITVVVINTYLAEVLADYDEKNETLLVSAWTGDTTQESYKASADDVTKDMTAYKEGDYVMIKRTVDDSTVREVLDPKMITNVALNLYTTTKQDNTKGDVQKVGTVDGETYTIAKMAFYDPQILRNYNLTELKDFTYDLFIDQYGNMIGIQYNKRDTSLVFVAGYEKDSTVLAAQTVKANLIFMDGSMVTKAVALAPKGTAYTYFNNITATDNAVKNGANDRANGKNQTLNAWFTYAKDDNGNITLRDIVEAANSTKVTNGAFKQYAVKKDNVGGDPAISSTRSTYDYYTAAGTKLTVLADDNTVFISAVADNTVKHTVNGTLYTGAVAKVNGVVTGVKNATISTVDVTKAVMEDQTVVNLNAFKERIGEGYTGVTGYTEYGEDNANVFYVFDAKGYVVAAVALTDKLAADHLAFITSLVKQRELIGGAYYDTYKAITPEGGKEEVTLKVNSDRTNTTNDKLAKNTLYAVAYDKDQNVILASAVASNIDDVNTQASRRFGYAEMQVGDLSATSGTTVAKITLGDVLNTKTTNMVYGYDADKLQLGYIATAASGNFWTLKDGDYVWHPTASSAFNDAIAPVDGTEYEVTGVYAICDKATGFSGTMVFVATEKTGDVALSSKVVAINNAGVGVYDGMRFYAEDAHIITYAEARAAVLAKIKADLPASNPTFIDVDTVEFTMNGKTVKADILALNANATTINNTTYQVYKVTYLTDGNSVYLNRNEGANVLAAALKKEDADSTYTAGTTLFLSQYNPTTKENDVNYIGLFNGISVDALRLGDIQLAKAATEAASMNKLITSAKGKTINLWCDVGDGTGTLTVPAGKELVLYSDGVNRLTINVETLNVAGEIKEDGIGLPQTITVAKDATVTGKMTGPNTTLTVGGTLYFKSGAVGVLLGAVANQVVIGCDLTVGTLKANKIYLVGDDAQGSNLTADTITDKAGGNTTEVYLGYSYSASGAQKNSGAENMTLTVKANTELKKTTVNGENATLAADGDGVKLTTPVTVEEGSEVVLDSVKGAVTLEAGAHADLEDGSTVDSLVIDGSNTSVTAKNGTTIEKVEKGDHNTESDKVEITTEGKAEVKNANGMVETGKAVTVSVTTIDSNGTGVYLTTSDTVTVAFDKVLDTTVKVGVKDGVDVTGGSEVAVSGQRVTFKPTGPDDELKKDSVTFTISGVKPNDSVLESGEVAAATSWTVTFDAETGKWTPKAN